MCFDAWLLARAYVVAKIANRCVSAKFVDTKIVKRNCNRWRVLYNICIINPLRVARKQKTNCLVGFLSRMSVQL